MGQLLFNGAGAIIEKKVTKCKDTLHLSIHVYNNYRHDDAIFKNECKYSETKYSPANCCPIYFFARHI
jgi:hypothetical protein